MANFADQEHPARGLKRLRLLGLKRVSPEKRSRPSAVFLQIDGLSYRNFRRAIGSGKLPFLSRLLRKRQAVAGPWHAMLPTSTAAFQAGLFYGHNDNIPGFHWYDKITGREVHMNGTGDTARVEEEIQQQAPHYRGLLAGGSSYSALYTGGADNTFLTFARLFSPRYNLTTKRRWLMLFMISQLLLLGRVLYYTVIELILTLYDLIRGLLSRKNTLHEFKFAFPRIFSVVVCREIATLAAILDIYRGVGPIYVNYFAYDEHAHHRGPDSRFAFWALRGIDASIRRIWKAAQKARRSKIRHYDVFIWSDHGQVESTPFHDLFQETPEYHFDMLFQALYRKDDKDYLEKLHGQAGVKKTAPIQGTHHAPLFQMAAPENLELQARRADFVSESSPRWLAHLVNRLMQPALDFRSYIESLSPTSTARGFHFVSTGPMAHAYFTDDKEPLTYEQVRMRYPYFLELIAQHKGCGFILCRTGAGGCQIGYDGQWLDIFDEEAIRAHFPLDFARIILSRRKDLCRWANMKSSGDLLIFGQREPDRPVITYTYEHGSHGGPSPQETLPFLLVPVAIAPNWPEISHEKVEKLLTLKDLHHRLRQAYNPQRIVELKRDIIPLDIAIAPESYSKQA